MMGDNLKLTGSIQQYFWHKVVCVFYLLWRFTCLNTYSDRQLPLTGAQQFVDGAVKQLVIMEADITGIGANHHRVFLRHQFQIARPFLRQKHTETAVIRTVVRDQRGLWTGTDNVHKDHSSLILTYRKTHLHTHTLGSWAVVTQLSLKGSQHKTLPVWARLQLKAANNPAASLTWPGKFLQTNPLTVVPTTAQNNILRVFTGAC